MVLGIVSIIVVSLILLFILDSVGVPLGQASGYQPATPPQLENDLWDHLWNWMGKQEPLCKLETVRCEAGKNLVECKLATPNFCSWCEEIPTEVNTECEFGCLSENVDGQGPAKCIECEPASKCQDKKISGINPRTCKFTTSIEDCNTYAVGKKTSGCVTKKMYNYALEKDVEYHQCVCYTTSTNQQTQKAETIRVSCKGESIED